MRQKYYMFIDECGDQNLSNFETTFPIFTLCGIIVSEGQNQALNKEEINSILGEEGAYKVVTCSILKEDYIRQFGRFNDVYGQCLSLLVERAIFYLDDLNIEKGIDLSIYAEMRGKKEDANLLSYYNQLRDLGTYWVTPERIKSHIKRFDFLSKRANVTGLQIADLVAYPITRHILEPKLLNLAYEIVKCNIYKCNDKLLGMKIIPRQ